MSSRYRVVTCDIMEKIYRIEIHYEENTCIYKKRNRTDGKPRTCHPLHVPRPSGQKIHLLHRLAFHHTPVLPNGCYGWIQGNRSVPHDRKCTACTRSYNETIVSCTGVASICVQHVYHKRCLTDYLCAVCDHCAFHVGEGTSDHPSRCDADNRCKPRKYAYADGESTELVSVCQIRHVPRYIRGNYAPLHDCFAAWNPDFHVLHQTTRDRNRPKQPCS